ncbi:MAG: adenylate/guanylate cyclase domain-containing protein [Actinomycetota bacterium]
MDEGETLHAEDLVRENANLREQRRAIGDVLRAVARSEGLQPVLDEIVSAAKQLCDGEHGQLYLAEGDLFVVSSQFGDVAEGYAYAEEHPHLRDRTTVVGRAALAGEAVQIPDVLADDEYSFEGQAIVGYRALLGVPIVLDGELIGVIAVGRNVPGPFTDEQVELVKTFADQAAIAIANARLIETVERQRTELSRFLSPQVAELISSTQGEQMLTGHRAYISCFFCDLRGFTAFAETAAPEELFEVLRDYHEALGELISHYGGTLEHFAGDGILVFFNDPLAVDDHELQAIRLAIAAQERLAELAPVWRKRGTGLGLGIEAGYATLGRIGYEGRYDYAALGPVVNLASRLSDHAAVGQILIGQHVFGAVEERVDTAPVGELDLKGFARPVPAYEVLGLRTEP